jgi:YD repeat-containing protein
VRTKYLLLISALLLAPVFCVHAEVGVIAPIQVYATVSDPSAPTLTPVVVSASYTSPINAASISYSSGSRWGKLSDVKFASNAISVAGTPVTGTSCSVGDPVLPNTGVKIEDLTLFALPGEMGLSYSMHYYTFSPGTNATAGWRSNFAYALDLGCYYEYNPSPCGYITYFRPDGKRLYFNVSSKIYNKAFQSTSGLAILTGNGDGTFTLQDEDARTLTFRTVGFKGLLTSIKDASGIGWSISGDESQDPWVTVTHTSGASFTVENAFDGGQTYKTITDPSGNKYYFNRNLPAGIDNIALPGNPTTAIYYKHVAGLMVESGYNGFPYSYTQYDDSKRVIGTRFADDSGFYSFEYLKSSYGTVIVNPFGHRTVQQYDTEGRIISESRDAVSTCGATINYSAYDANGKLSQTIDNNGVIHTYVYAANGQLQTETEAAGTSLARTTNYVWDPDVRLNRLLSETVVGVKQTAYSYNAQNRLASVSVTNLSGGGIARQTLTTRYDYTLYPNGMVQTLRVTRPSPNDADTSVYTYDALGNLTSEIDGLGHATAYSWYNALGEVGRVVGPNGDTTDYAYDARGRIIAKTIYPNGNASSWRYTYDAYGLLASETAPDNRVTVWTRNALMQVISITRNDKDGTSTETFSYNPNGDVSRHVIARGNDIALAENFGYDGLGRLYQKQGSHGQLLTYAYDGNGNVLSVTNAMGHVTSHQYDALNRVIATFESGGASPAVPAPAVAPALAAPSSNTTGAYALSWNTVSGANLYVLQEQVNGGAWLTVQSKSITSWSVAGRLNGNYAYRIQACNDSGCGPWSTSSTVVVAIPGPPAAAPGLSVPASPVVSSSYAIVWNGVATANYYVLQEQVNGGAWTMVQNNEATSWGATGRGNATYGYRVQACNAVGCGPWSAAASVRVAANYPISGLNGGNFRYGYTTPTKGTGFTVVGFDIAGGATWEVFSGTPSLAHTVRAQGSVPVGAVSVQITWTSLGPVGGDGDAGGSVTNGAASPMPLSSNPYSEYRTAGWGANQSSRSRSYRVQVDFYDAYGTDISQSVFTMTASVQGSAT